MKHPKTKFNVILFCLLLVLFVFIGIIAPKDDSAAEKENRTLATMPDLTQESLFSGSFSRDFENYLADNVGFRSFFMNFSSRLQSLKGFKPKSGKMVSTAKDLGTGVQGENQLLLLSDRVMEVFHKNPDAKTAYAEALNHYAEILPEDVRLINMLIPTQIEFYEGQSVSASEKETIDAIYNSLHTRIVTVPVYEELDSHNDEYIYFRTDHHWTQRGAFYGYSAFNRAAGFSEPNINDYEIHSREGFLGYLYNQAKDPTLAKHADTIEYFVKGKNLTVSAKAMENGTLTSYASKLFSLPSESEIPKYGIFMGGDHPFAEITTENKNGKTLLVMKDSYANTLIPFLTEQYETVLVIDPRNFYSTVTALTEEYKIDDILIVNYVFTTTFSDFIEKMVAIS